MPNHEQVRIIYKKTYEFYLKWDNKIKADSQWIQMVKEAKALYQDYSFDLCKDILTHLLHILEKQKKLNESRRR